MGKRAGNARLGIGIPGGGGISAARPAGDLIDRHPVHGAVVEVIATLWFQSIFSLCTNCTGLDRSPVELGRHIWINQPLCLQHPAMPSHPRHAGICGRSSVCHSWNDGGLSQTSRRSHVGHGSHRTQCSLLAWIRLPSQLFPAPVLD